MGFPCGSASKESASNVGDLGWILWLGRSPGEGKGSPLQDSGLENSMDWTPCPCPGGSVPPLGFCVSALGSARSGASCLISGPASAWAVHLSHSSCAFCHQSILSKPLGLTSSFLPFQFGDFTGSGYALAFNDHQQLLSVQKNNYYQPHCGL